MLTVERCGPLASKRLTSICDSELRVDELVALQDLSETTPLMLGLLYARGGAEGQVVVVVRLLGVVILRASMVEGGYVAGCFRYIIAKLDVLR